MCVGMGRDRIVSAAAGGWPDFGSHFWVGYG